MKIFLFAAFFIIVFSCTKTIDSFCLSSNVIYLKKGESSTIHQSTLRQIVRHNKVYVGICGNEEDDEDEKKK